MRLLFVALSYPLPANNGHKIRTWALLRALAAEGHDVSLLAFAREDEVPADEASVRAVCRDVEIVPIGGGNVVHAREIAGRLARLVSPRPYAVSRYASPAMRTRILARARRDRFDAIICDIFTFASVPALGIPIVVNNENIEHVMLRRYLRHESNPAKRLYVSLEAWKMERWERAVWRQSAVALVCSDTDRRALGRLCPAVRTAIVPNVVDTDTYVPNGAGEPARLLFQGGMDYLPNQDAVSHFITSILPALRSLVPGVRFVVAGRNPSPALLRRFGGLPDVEFTGTVPDMRVELARAAVCVVPLRIGSGTRLKILEAAAMGKAIVSTRIGAEGLDFTDGEDIVIADDPSDFAHAVARILEESDCRLRLGKAARALVEREYGFAALKRRLARALSIPSALKDSTALPR